MTGMTTCPDCEGRKGGHALVDGVCNKRRFSESRWILCMLCQGTGFVSEVVATRYAVAKQLRLGRIARNVSLREEALRLDIDHQELSDIEHGWREPLPEQSEAVRVSALTWLGDIEWNPCNPNADIKGSPRRPGDPEMKGL